jgi:uncharacterized protein
MSETLFDIPELDDLAAGGGLIRVPMETNVPFTPRVRAIVDTPQFQRLGQISQLGLVAKVYPGARHTRFEHALGVFHKALCYLQHLRLDERFCAVVDRRSAELLLVSALLHDLGHWPFCHPIEDMEIPGLRDHEAYAARFLAPEGELGQVLQREWEIDPADVLDLLSPRTDAPPRRLLRSILSGPVDVDKMDYLDRDSLHCGVPYGRNFDRQRLIQSLVVNAAGDGLAISYKGKTAAELMVFARYVMFSEVYWHHSVRAATSLFARSFFELHNRIAADELFELAETEMITRLRAAAQGTPCEWLLEGIFGPRRQLYKRVAEYTHDQQSTIYSSLARRPFADLVRCGNELTRIVSKAIGRSLMQTDLLIDGPPPHREIEFDIDVYYPRTGEYRRLGDVSPVVDALACTQFDEYVKRVRIFGRAEVAAALRDRSDVDALVAEAIEASFGS